MNDRYTGEELFRLVGFEEYTDVDFDASEVKIIHDFNQPIPEDWHCQYDYVFENGTIEHIFDVKQAIFNVAQLVSVGGYVSHASPLDAFNHGFITSRSTSSTTSTWRTDLPIFNSIWCVILPSGK